jgi:hypothetical protein
MDEAPVANEDGPLLAGELQTKQKQRLVSTTDPHCTINNTLNRTNKDGQSAAVLSANDTTLPAGWSAPGGTLACATARTGNGCELSPAYAPTPTGSVAALP